MAWIDIPNTEIVSAVAGNSAALENIMRATQQPVYNLALRFLWHPQDAQDNTQEILIKVMTNLSSFRGESAYGTWAYRIAVPLRTPFPDLIRGSAELGRLRFCRALMSVVFE